jgi:hypothetical protein
MAFSPVGAAFASGQTKEIRMRSTRITVVLLAVALAAAGATPVLAAKNNGGFQLSSEGNKAPSAYCTISKGWFQQSVGAMNSAQKGSEAYNRARENANEVLGNAWAAGCAWAQ